MSHTPGPWTADWDDSGQWYVNIGSLCVSGNALRGDSEECVESANAHLIAAAPELLEGLKQARTTIHTAVSVATAGLYDTRQECEAAANEHITVKRCDWLIAKAEGR